MWIVSKNRIYIPKNREREREWEKTQVSEIVHAYLIIWMYFCVCVREREGEREQERTRERERENIQYWNILLNGKRIYFYISITINYKLYIIYNPNDDVRTRDRERTSDSV